MKRLLIVIATYNEIENLPNLVDSLCRLLPPADLLVIDDDSPDGTGRWAEQMSRQQPRLRVIHRPRKSGLGSATKLGLQQAITAEYEFVATLDADWSHSPEDLARMWSRISDPHLPATDIVIGSRYVSGGAIIGWPWRRRWASKVMNIAVRWGLGVRARDASGALRIYRTEALSRLDWSQLRCQGYFYLEEILLALQWRKARWVEVPITFRNRTAGHSKINLREIAAAAGHLLRLSLKRWRWLLWLLLLLTTIDAAYAGYVRWQIARWESQQDWDEQGVMAHCAAYSQGQGDTAVLFIHGYNENAYTWRKMLPALAQRNYHCRAMRLPGFGESIADYGRYSVDDWIQAVTAELDMLRSTHKRVVIVAHSLGGALAIAIDQRQPKAVDQLILLAPAIEVSNQRSPLLPTRYWFELSGWFLWTHTFAMPFGNDAVDPAEAGNDHRQPFTPRRVVAQLFELVDRNRGQANQHQTPALWFASQTDPIVDSKASRDYFDAWGADQKQWYWVQPAGHSLPYDLGWEQIVQRIDEFLSGEVGKEER